MKWRLTLVIVMILVRVIYNLISTDGFVYGRWVSIRFNNFTVERRASKCIIKSRIFWVRGVGSCESVRVKNLLVSGRVRASLIDRLMGRIWLDQSSFISVEDVRSEAPDWMRLLVSRLVQIAQNSLPNPEADLVLGVVVGYKASLTKVFYDQLVNSGTVHMVVASGYNVMVVAGLALGLFLFVWPRWVATLLALAVVVFYVILSGAQVSLVRAAFMGSVVLLGQVFGRTGRVWWSLLLVVCLMLLIEPSLIESISFQLSIAATGGVAMIGPWLKNQWGRADRLDLTTSLGALLATAPLIWFHFGRFSMTSIISNSLILPLVPVLMALGGAMLLVGLFSATLAGIVAWPTYALAHLIVLLVGFFGKA